MIHCLQIAAFSDEMEKIAFLGEALIGAGLHVGANSGYKLLRTMKAGKRFEAGQVATGFRHALGGKKMNPIARNVATYGVGPESLMNYDMGQALGGEMSAFSKGRRYRELKKLRKNVAMSSDVRHAPIGESVVPAVNRILSDKRGLMDHVPTVAANAKTTMGQHAISAGLGAGLAIAKPHTAMHMGINATRNLVGRSAVGQKFMRNQFLAGAQGRQMPKALKTAYDFGVSPAALDTRRLGEALHAERINNPQVGQRLGMSVLGQFSGLPSGKALANKGIAFSQSPEGQQRALGLATQYAPQLQAKAQGAGLNGIMSHLNNLRTQLATKGPKSPAAMSTMSPAVPKM